jgi:hypothetical protein
MPQCWEEGPTPLEAALERCAALRARADTRERETLIDKGYALALAMAGRIDEARTNGRHTQVHARARQTS